MMTHLPPVQVTTANLHLFGQLAMSGREQKPTPLYFRDMERADAIVDYFLQSGSQIIGLQEIWDPHLARQISVGLKGRFPHQVFTRWERGIDVAVRSVVRSLGIEPAAVEDATDRIVREIAMNHYQLSHSLLTRILRRFMTEDVIAILAQRLFRIPPIMGAGLLFLSQYPIDKFQTNFEPHLLKADWERFTHKGTVRAVVTIPGMGPVTVLTTHLQEGVSKSARRARDEQIRGLRRLIDRSDYPVIALGDFNVERDQRSTRPPENERRKRPRRTDDFKKMIDILGLQDTYSHFWFRNLSDNPGHTYSGGPFAGLIGFSQEDEENHRSVIDYILHDRNWEVDVAEVDDRHFFLDAAHTVPLSDHHPLTAVLTRKLELPRRRMSTPIRTPAPPPAQA